MENNEVKDLSADDQIALFLKLFASKIRNAKRSPLSFSQERIWSIAHLNPENISFNISNSFYIYGELDEVVLEKSLNEIVRRHDILRSIFLMENEKPVQVTLPMFSFRLKTMDVSTLGSDKTALEQTINREKNQSFDLHKDLLFRAVLLRLAEQKYILILVMHQIIVDGESWPIVIRELTSIYQALKKGRVPSLPNLAMQYADYAGWQRERLKGDTYTLLSNYWRDRFQESVAPLQLPADRFHTTNPDNKAHIYKFTIEPEIHTQLKQLSQKEKVSLFVTLLTTFNCLLYMYTNQEHFLVFTSVSSKNRPELATLIGLFSNLLPLQVKIMQNLNLIQIMEITGREVGNDVAHQDFPFDRISEFIKLKLPDQRAGYSSLFQVMFTFRHMDTFEYNLGDIRLEPIEIELEKELNFQIRLGMIERTDHLECALTYNAAVFEESTIRQIVEHYLLLLETCLNTPDLPISELSVFQRIAGHSRLLAGKRAERLEYTVEYAAPNNEMEEKLVEIWQEVLGIEKVGVNDNFFDLGGHSLKAITISDLCKKNGIDLRIPTIFQYTTIAAICKNVNMNTDIIGSKIPDEKADDVGADIDTDRFGDATADGTTGLDMSGNCPVKELPIKLQRNVNTYLFRSFPLCIILAHDEFIPWYNHHLIQIYGQIHPDGFIMLDYLEKEFYFTEIMDCSECGFGEMAGIDNIVNFIIEKLDNGTYVKICLDEYYIKSTPNYLKEHFVHENFMYGYDSIHRRFRCVGFENKIFGTIDNEYEVVAKAYENAKNCYKVTAPYADEHGFQFFTPKKFDREVPFDPMRFMSELEDYMTSRGDKGRTFFMCTLKNQWQPNMVLSDEKLKYGLDAEDLVLDRLEKMIGGEILLDYRAIHLLAEHKKELFAKFQYIIERYDITGEDLRMLERYRTIVDYFETIRIKSFEILHMENLEDGLKILPLIIEKMRSAIQMERRVLKEIYGILEAEFKSHKY